MGNESEKNDFASDPEVIEVANIYKAKQKALAFLRRGQKANIPDKHFRINANQFAELIDFTYVKDNKRAYRELFGENYSATNQQEFASCLYDNAEKLLEMNYIIIDGGNSEARRRAGSALLFRLILCDRWGMYKECSELSHKFQTINADGGDIHRNVIASQLKKYDILFISEFYPKLMSVHFETGSFFDEVLVARRYSHKTTIISFSEPMQSESVITNKEYGVTFADLSKQFCPSQNVLRIKVVPYESK
jgi:hypothetical protein